MKVIMSVFLCLTMTVAFIGAREQPFHTEESVPERFLRACYEVADYTTLPYETLQRNHGDVRRIIENVPDNYGIILIDNSECREFLTNRFSDLCSGEQIEKMMADLILLDYYRVLSTSKFNATVGDIVLTKKPHDVGSTRRLYGYELTVLVKSPSTGQEVESTLSGRMATDIVDGVELVVYMNYGGEIFPTYPQ